MRGLQAARTLVRYLTRHPRRVAETTPVQTATWPVRRRNGKHHGSGHRDVAVELPLQVPKLCPSPSVAQLERVDQRVPGHSLVLGNRAKDRIQSADANRLVRRHRKSLVRREIRIQNDMTSYLMHLMVAPVTTERIGQFPARQVTREPHATETTSSRTRWRRTLAGAVLSK